MRRKNPDSDIFEFALFAAVGYGLWYVFTQMQSFFKTGPGSIPITGAANAFVNLTAGPAAVASGMINLPNGSQVAVNDVNPTEQPDGSTGFTQGGVTYTINPGTDSQGNWTAVQN